MYCITCGEDAKTLLTIDSKKHYHWVTRHFEFWEAGIDEMCFGPFTQSPPPPITEDTWSFIFAHEPSDDEMELIEQESLLLNESLIAD